ncbi:MAG: hypothetical protein ACLRM9_01310 [Collinsella aerofaciens]
MTEPAAQSQSTPAPSHFATPEPRRVSPQDDESTACASEEPGSPDTGDSESNAETDTVPR